MVLALGIGKIDIRIRELKLPWEPQSSRFGKMDIRTRELELPLPQVIQTREAHQTAAGLKVIKKQLIFVTGIKFCKFNGLL